MQKAIQVRSDCIKRCVLLICAVVHSQAAHNKPNILMLMTDDTGWNDFGCYSGGGASLGHPTPNIDRMAKEGAVFTSWYGQASCTAGRSSFITVYGECACV